MFSWDYHNALDRLLDRYFPLTDEQWEDASYGMDCWAFEMREGVKKQVIKRRKEGMPWSYCLWFIRHSQQVYSSVPGCLWGK